MQQQQAGAPETLSPLTLHPNSQVLRKLWLNHGKIHLLGP
jgi:hypothetical protein